MIDDLDAVLEHLRRVDNALGALLRELDVRTGADLALLEQHNLDRVELALTALTPARRRLLLLRRSFDR